MAQGEIMFKFQEEFYKKVTESVATLPKTSEEIKSVLEKVKNVVITETKRANKIMDTYRKAATGDASVNEIAIANKNVKDVVCAARFATIMSIPGAIFMIPTLDKIHLDLGIEDFIPESVKKEFNL